MRLANPAAACVPLLPYVGRPGHAKGNPRQQLDLKFEIDANIERLDFGRFCFSQALVAWVHSSGEAVRGGDSMQQFG
jgi:hypothetical protein